MNSSAAVFASATRSEATAAASAIRSEAADAASATRSEAAVRASATRSFARSRLVIEGASVANPARTAVHISHYARTRYI